MNRYEFDPRIRLSCHVRRFREPPPVPARPDIGIAAISLLAVCGDVTGARVNDRDISEDASLTSGSIAWWTPLAIRSRRTKPAYPLSASPRVSTSTVCRSVCSFTAISLAKICCSASPCNWNKPGPSGSAPGRGTRGRLIVRIIEVKRHSRADPGAARWPGLCENNAADASWLRLWTDRDRHRGYSSISQARLTARLPSRCAARPGIIAWSPVGLSQSMQQAL
jgi:hypothetical protein